MYFWTELTGKSASLMNITFYCHMEGDTYYGFESASTLTFKYMFVRNTFPNKYMCYTMLDFPSYTMAVGASKIYTLSILDKANPAPITLNATDTVFIYSFSDGSFSSTNTPLDSSFEITLAYNVINSTNFNFTITANLYPMVL